ncbi:hypothetical protein AB1Y20_008088 [Prymnesium parvum]|uniref:PDZ domain-containing protein n=1 Tax=Prymnesium parvum TaxID=97485 RepID=A0AB34IUG2_PRYPA|mmetsp:Transcript_4732/g.10441  ORF Transcript_4732/g.10441 Transcript_4732/m.10441 type:complete len:247 (-) Transcript_4732:174-914(-)
MLRRFIAQKKDACETLDITVARSSGKLGLVLTMNSSRVMQVTKGSAAESSGIRSFDRIIAVNGSPVTTTLGDLLAIQQGTTIVLRVERPPPSEHQKIKAEEDAIAAALVLTGSSSTKASRRSGAKTSVDSAKIPAIGMECHTITLLRTDNPLAGLEIGPRSEILIVTLDSTAHKAGLRVGDIIFKLNGKELLQGNGDQEASDAQGKSFGDVLNSLGASDDLVLSVRRGRAFDEPISHEGRVSSAVI